MLGLPPHPARESLSPIIRRTHRVLSSFRVLAPPHETVWATRTLRKRRPDQLWFTSLVDVLQVSHPDSMLLQ